MIRIRVQTAQIEELSQSMVLIEQAFINALDRFEHVIHEADIRLVDINGPKGGVDKCCKARLCLHPRGIIVVKAEASSLIDAANEACDKARRAIAKRLDKKRRGPGQRQARLNLGALDYAA